MHSSTGIEIHDELRFFCGDKPAQQFERGTQVGDTYKCGACGCKDTMMEDLAHAFRRTWRSLADIQEIALAGKFGNTAGQLKPLEDLRVKQLHQEPEARGYATGDQRKPRLQAELTSILSGVQRVPTLLAL